MSCACVCVCMCICVYVCACSVDISRDTFKGVFGYGNVRRRLPRGVRNCGVRIIGLFLYELARILSRFLDPCCFEKRVVTMM